MKKALMLNFGMNFNNTDDLDNPQNRLKAQKIIKMIENVP